MKTFDGQQQLRLFDHKQKSNEEGNATSFTTRRKGSFFSINKVCKLIIGHEAMTKQTLT